MTRPARRVSGWRLGFLVGLVLVVGLSVGLAADAVLDSRPIVMLVSGVLAAQVAMVLVYRDIVASFRSIGDDSGEGKGTAQQ